MTRVQQRRKKRGRGGIAIRRNRGERRHRPCPKHSVCPAPGDQFAGERAAMYRHMTKT